MNPGKAIVAALAAKYGPQLHTPDGIDGARLMLAISGAESSFGANCNPRHEPSYDRGGCYASHDPMPGLLEKYGTAAACSYGPWQVLLANVPEFPPYELISDPDACARAFVTFANRYVFGCHKPRTVDEFAQTYNSGHFSSDPAPGVQRYADQVSGFYNQPFPAQP